MRKALAFFAMAAATLSFTNPNRYGNDWKSDMRYTGGGGHGGSKKTQKRFWYAERRKKNRVKRKARKQTYKNRK